MITLLLMSLMTQPVTLRCPGVKYPELLSITIAVFDYTSVPEGELSSARAEISRIYCNIGVEVAWWDERVSEDLVPKEALVVVVRPESKFVQRTFASNVMGAAIGTEGNRGRVAYIVYERVFQTRTLQRGKILGCLMAHEIGHLLLPFLTHSRQGIMRAQWDTRDLELAEANRLAFTKQQIDQIHSTVRAIGRVAAEQDAR